MKLKTNLKKLKTEIVKAGFNITDVAKLTGVSKQYIGQILNGKIAIGGKTAIKVANILNIDFEELFEVE